MQFVSIFLYLLAAQGANQLYDDFRALALSTSQPQLAQQARRYGTAALLCACVCLLAQAGRPLYFWKISNYHGGSDVRFEIDYLKEHLTPNDAVYVYSYSKAVFDYEFGYPPADADWILYGQELITLLTTTAYAYDGGGQREEAILEDVQRIAGRDSVYLLFSLNSDTSCAREHLLEELAPYGTLTVIDEADSTYLYHFTHD